MDDELHSTPPSSWSCGQFSFPTESSEEPSSMLFNHPQHAYVGLHPGFDTTAPGVIPPDHITNDPTSAFSMNHTYNDHTKCSQRQHMNSWNQWTSAQGETAWTTARTTVPISAEQQPGHLLNPFDVQMDHSQRWQMFTQEPTEIFFTNEPNPELNTTLRKNSRTTDHNEIQEETHSAREERDFGEVGYYPTLHGT